MFSLSKSHRYTPWAWGLKNGHFAIGDQKIKFVKQIIFQTKYLSKITLRKGPQPAAHSDERLQSDGQLKLSFCPKNAFLGQNGSFLAITL